MNTERRVKGPGIAVKPIVERIWGYKQSHNDTTVSRRVEKFEMAICTLTAPCENQEVIEIPSLTAEQRASALLRINEAIGHLQRFVARIKEHHNE